MSNLLIFNQDKRRIKPLKRYCVKGVVAMNHSKSRYQRALVQLPYKRGLTISAWALVKAYNKESGKYLVEYVDGCNRNVLQFLNEKYVELRGYVDINTKPTPAKAVYIPTSKVFDYNIGEDY